MKKQLIIMIAATMICSSTFADWISDESMEMAALSWLSSDRVAQLTMKSLTFDRLVHRSSLRIVHLSPSGYIVMSGSDIADPVICFSRNDFVEPEEGSPFHAMLEHSDSDVGKLEAAGGVRAAKWTDIIGSRDGTKPSKRRLMAENDGEEPSTVLIEPFMTTHWGQAQPYNDFVPVNNPDDTGGYRGRCPCGCVATAAAQQIAHFKWPWRTGRAETFDHTLDKEDGNGKTNWMVRFTGNASFDWEMIKGSYTGYSGDSRGKIDESERFPVARLMSWVDTITKMGFGKSGSGANFGAAKESLSEWYEQWEVVRFDEDYETNAAKVKSDIEAGVPVHVGVPGHAVVAHGWASDGEDDYVYLNYGWSGSADGWYILSDRTSSSINNACPGFLPRKKVQLEPLTAVCKECVDVRWHLPEYHEDEVQGFLVKVMSFGDSVCDETVCDFTSLRGVASNPVKTQVTNHIDDVANDTDFLWYGSWGSGTYDLPGERVLTGSSVLSYRVSSANVGQRVVEILASFDGGEWQTVSKPMLNRSVSSGAWSTERAFLGTEAGKIARFRIKVSWAGGRVLFDDFILTDVIVPSGITEVAVASDQRNYAVTDLAEGCLAGVCVTPVFADGSGEISETHFTRIAGAMDIPLPSVIAMYETNDVSYASVEVGDAWSFRGDVEDDTTVRMGTFSGGVDVSLPGMLTADSVLEFFWRVAGLYSEGERYDILTAIFEDGRQEENLLWCVTNCEKRTELQTVRLPLGKFAGASGAVKIAFRHVGSNWTGVDSKMRIVSPRITNVKTPVIPEAKWERMTFKSLPAPEILSIKGQDGLEIDEGLYRELGIGEDSLRISCSRSVIDLHAFPSQLSLMGDNDVRIEKITNGEFLMRMNTAKIPRRSRMILTLEAIDSNYTKAYRDLSLRFDNSESVAQLDRWRKVKALSCEPTDVFTFDNSDKKNSGKGDMSIGGGCSEYVESPLRHALYHTDGVDGPWQSSSKKLDLSQEWTVLTIAKTCESNNAVLFQMGSSGSGFNGLALASGGKDKITLSYWESREQHVDYIVSDVHNSSSQYHSYAVRAKGLSIDLFVDGVLSGSAIIPAMPTAGFQFFSVIGGSGKTGLVKAGGECIDDWRMYDIALPDTAIAAYANTLLMFDPAKAGMDVGDVIVPERWFEKYYPSGTMSLSALSAKAANGRNVWECYVAGLDPTNEDDELVADITFENGVPKVSIANGEKSNRMYRILATKTLDEAETPHDVTNVPNLSVETYRDYRFFRVCAELP